MNEIQPRYKQILSVLADNVYLDNKGLTTRQVFDLAMEERLCELKDTSITSQCIYAMRGKNWIQTEHPGTGPDYHLITPEGLKVVIENGYSAPEHTEYDAINEDRSDDVEENSDGVIRMLVDNFVDQLMLRCVKTTISDKAVKVKLLERLIEIMDEGIKEQLNEIKGIIETMDG